MGELLEIVGSLENKISKLVHKMDQLDRENRVLEGELAKARQEMGRLGNTAREWEDKYNSLKMASTVLGSDANKKEAKLKINTLIRELDHCIAQLAE